MSRITSFEPVCSRESRLLILGTMPGTESLRLQQYYGHPRNQFWRIIFDLTGSSTSGNYSERIKFLISNRIALWDVLQSCEREGSLDKDIRSEKPNNIPELLNRHPSINRIFCNGQGSRRLLKKFYPELFTAYDVTVLPSTSPAYTARYEEKLETWKLLMNDTAP